MSKSLIGWLIVAVLGGVIGALTFLESPALAGNLALLAGTPGAGTVTTAVPTPTTGTPGAGTVTTVTPTPTTGTSGAGTGTSAVFVPTNLLIFFLLLLLIFGLILIVGILIYVYKIQLKYYATTQSLSQMGVGVKATPISFFGSITAAAAAQQPNKLMIDGPGFVTVGAHADFTVKEELGGNLANDAQWSITPDDAASWSPKMGAKVTVLPLKMGPFVLTASAPKAEGAVSVAAVAPQATTEELPFIGQGYGSLVIAVLVVITVILLALTGILTGEAVATLLGGLLGYIFGVTTSTGATSSKKSNNK
jgi:hypothetical protein